ncbi:MAG TPA: VOC family protein [Kineosporiaceae bacterium]|nr:VOC family protein [Kineosporiaceae bacterium]
MSVPQTITFITLGSRDVPVLRAFYAGWGWRELPGGEADFAQYDMGGVRLALYSLELLRAEASPDCLPPEPGRWSGITLAVNVGSREAVDAAYDAAVQASARIIARPVDREWGGYSGYLADPEGNRWEIAWLPGFTPLSPDSA